MPIALYYCLGISKLGVSIIGARSINYWSSKYQLLELWRRLYPNSIASIHDNIQTITQLFYTTYSLAISHLVFLNSISFHVDW